MSNETVEQNFGKQFRDKFFKECTYKPDDGFIQVQYSIAPHDLFEWFKNEFVNRQQSQLSETGQQKLLEDRLFTLGEMNKPPCFCCGYNGEGYYQPEKHPCAERHHKLFNNQKG